jgi:mannose-P-dolichol utilization defect 1
MFNELVMYGFNIAYNVNMGTDFMLYGENIFIIFQNFILLYLFKVYSKETSWGKFLSHMVIFFVLVLPLLFGLVPKQVFVFSIYINILLSTHSSLIQVFVSRAPQIHLNYKNQSTGQLAWITCFLNLAGSLTRAFTYVVSSSDWLYNVVNIIYRRSKTLRHSG